jgi:hypothetical protein
VALPFTFKKYLKAKEELWKFKYFTMPKYDLQKYALKETKILKDIITPCCFPSFHTSQNIRCFKNPPIKVDLLTRGL